MVSAVRQRDGSVSVTYVIGRDERHVARILPGRLHEQAIVDAGQHFASLPERKRPRVYG